MKVLVGAAAEILSEQEFYRKEVPLMTLALAVREVTARASLPVEESDATEQLSKTEVSGIIKVSVAKVNTVMEGSYVQSGKTNPALYSAYFTAIETLLLARYAERDGEGMSLFKCLGELRTNLSLIEYRRTHRAQLEYLFKLSEREFLAAAKKVL